MELHRDNLTAPPVYPAKFVEAMFPNLCCVIPERHPPNNAERLEGTNLRLGDLDALHDIVWKWTKDEDADHAQIECFDAFLAQIEDAPTVEATPVVHGAWKYYHKQNKAVCTNCSFERDLDLDFGKAVSCPNCAAKMDL